VVFKDAGEIRIVAANEIERAIRFKSGVTLPLAGQRLGGLHACQRSIGVDVSEINGGLQLIIFRFSTKNIELVVLGDHRMFLNRHRQRRCFGPEI
jgi:hypothetical protein